MQGEKMSIYVPGITKEQEVKLENRIAEFERDHEADLVHGGPGYVPHIQNRDFVIAWVINAVLAVYYFWAILS